MLSTLDIISNGRAELGIGAGWYEQEYVAYGYDFPSARTRIMQLDESISIIKAMWTEEYASFEGKYYKIKDAICNPKPIQKRRRQASFVHEYKYLLTSVQKSGLC